MFGIVAERIQNTDGTIRYAFKMHSIKFSDHVTYDIPVTSNFWTKDIRSAVEALPNICNPITNNVQQFIDPSNRNRLAQQALGENDISMQFNTWNYIKELNFFKEEVMKFTKESKKVTKLKKKMESLRHLSVNTIDPSEWLINAPSSSRAIAHHMNSGTRSFYDGILMSFLRVSDIIPDSFNYNDLLKVAKERLQENWSQFNIQKLCCAIACLEEDTDFRDARKAVYEIKPELKGTIKKIEDLTDLDPEIFTIDDFSKEEHEYHIINLMMGKVCYESQFVNAFLKTFKKQKSSITLCSPQEYISANKDVIAFTCINYSGLYSGHEYAYFDYQVMSDLAFSNSWIIEYVKESKQPFTLYPCKFSSETRGIIQAELSGELTFNQMTEVSDVKDSALLNSPEYEDNPMYSDIGKIAAIIGRKLNTSFPIKLSTEEIDMVINDSAGSKRWSVCTDGKRYESNSYSRHRHRDQFITKVMPGKFSQQEMVVPSAEINVESARTNIFKIKYEPIFGNDMIVADIKNLIKSLGYSTVNGTKDDLKKRFAECMVKQYEKKKDDLAEVFKDMKMICVVNDETSRLYKEDLGGINIIDAIDDYKRKSIVPSKLWDQLESNELRGIGKRILSCLIVCFIKTHNYANTIFSPDFENKMITAKGCMQDLVFRTWGQTIEISLVETSGDF